MCSSNYGFDSFSGDGSFSTTVDLPIGVHEYKFFVDGEQKHDPSLVSLQTRYNKCKAIKGPYLLMQDI